MNIQIIARMVIITIALSSIAFAASENETDFIENPPVFFNNEKTLPLTALTIPIPQPGINVPNFDIGQFDANGFRSNGQPVQPNLSVNTSDIRVGVTRGLSAGWCAGISVPWYRTKVGGDIGGLPASGIAEGLGDISFFGKKSLTGNQVDNYLNVFVGLELPTGKDNSVFSQSNSSTNAYYANSPQRMPISWQPGSGTYNGYLGLVYAKRARVISYAATMLGKFYSRGDEDVRIGNIFTIAGSGTYGVTKNIAVSLGLTLCTQNDDQYPNSPAPGISQPALAGTTTHGTTLFIDPSVRFRVFNRLVIGYGVRYPIVKPDDGMVPDMRMFLIFYPEF